MSKEADKYLPKPIQMRDYELSKTIGNGQFSIVKLAKTGQNNKFYAMKKIKKADMIKKGIVNHVRNEIKTLSLADNLYIQKYQGFGMDNKYVYIATELLTGGSFADYLKNEVKLTEDKAKFFAGEIVLILEFLHTKNIVYRDLHPENLLFDHKGYFRLIDFGFAKVCEGKTYTLCGTPEYMAPEIFLNKGHGKPVDWWAFGCILYEMLVGITPFFDNDPILIFKKVLRGDIKFPTNFPPAAKSLILHCLEKDENKRYGCLTRGIKDIKEHRFFNGLDMASLSKQKMRVVYLPPIDNADDMKLLKIITDEEEEAEEIDPAQDPFDEWIRKK